MSKQEREHEHVRDDPELFRVGDYVLLIHRENKAQTMVGMITAFTGSDEMDVFVPSRNITLHHVPIDVDLVHPIKFQGIRGRHCEVYKDSSSEDTKEIYWDGDQVLDPANVASGVCERVSFSSKSVSRENIKDLRSLIDRLQTRELRDRLRELGIDVHTADGKHLLSLAGLRQRYEEQMVNDIRTSLTRCDQLVRAAQSQCDKLEASCSDELLPWKKSACKKRVVECRLDAKLPKPLQSIGSTMQTNLDCLTSAGGDKATCGINPGKISEELNFFNNNCSLMQKVTDKHATRKQIDARIKARQ